MVYLDSFIRGGTASIYKGRLPQTVAAHRKLSDGNYVLVLAKAAEPLNDRAHLESYKLALDMISAADSYKAEIVCGDAYGERVKTFADTLQSLCDGTVSSSGKTSAQADIALCLFNIHTKKLFYYFNCGATAMQNGSAFLWLVDQKDDGLPSQVFFAHNNQITYGICNLFSDEMSVVLFNNTIGKEIMEKEDYCLRFPYESIFKLFPDQTGRCLGTKPYADQAYVYAELCSDYE